ncbi:MAG TPA: ABC transporter permease [Thermomicrobiales bacterium]|nr:ABC transporter permease [Thermomicrobiales bacterium]
MGTRTTGIGRVGDETASVRAPLSAEAARPRASVSWWGDVWRRFRRQKVSVAAAIVLACLVLLTVSAPVVAPHDPAKQFRRDGLSALGEPLPPNDRFLLGTDNLGRDLLSRLLWGGRVSLAIGISASAIVMAIALLLGGIAGFAGAKTDFLVMRFVDLMLSIPQLFVMLLLVVVLEPGIWVIVLVIAVFGWPYPARVFRSQILSLKEGEFVLAARCIGVPGSRILLRHLLPHLLPLVTVYLALSVPGAIFAEASLSFLGLGVPPPDPSWGSMIQDGMAYYRAAPWLVVFPGVAITLTVVSFNLTANGLREAMDPTRRGR